MTNYEFLKQADLELMAKYLCYMESTNENSDDPCDDCFASGMCFIGKNGIQRWLNQEYNGMPLGIDTEEQDYEI